MYHDCMDPSSSTPFSSVSPKIIMAIVGGAVLPPLLGLISDKTNNIQNGYFVPLVCFLVILYFGLKGYKHTEKAVEILH